ncbi:MAG: DNA primase [Candidatus Portnoybacteria bacterium CG03_land_8_20_14_0_80_41_10]|uniref:DNA primase n=1 Tax=Candidatus Portnoybacteria bacterium CG03_land_8_20_14_0_80_41_10 TaxID=1974808 RepID=A0A2M7BV83_9BACT|nr:MAG: DNA primase [Candidatus Portnoybacteria bacterium CG03_land_8_20_14_0_80_41_10]
MTSPVDEIKNRLDIVEIIGGYVRLQKAGRNYRALCPFHSEKAPSFFVSPERQLWRCFGCGKGGSIFDFIMEIEGVEFGDALRILAQRAGVELKKIDPKLKTERTRLYEICSLANQFFIRQLAGSRAGKQMQDYLNSRGLKSKTIKDWQIGYAPDGWSSLLEFLGGRGYPEGEIDKAGLAVKNEEKKKYYDRFRDRIIFPIRDLNGVTIGFSGRENPWRPNQQMGKYINTPNTLIYDKSRVLYGLDKAKLAIRKENFCILVEGQIDVVASHQAGFVNAVASSGTALTEEQLKIIKRYTENLSTAFDMDLAGQAATKRGIDLAIQLGFNTKVISLPAGQDPADYLLKNNSLWEQAIKKAGSLIEFYLENALAQYDCQTLEGKKEIAKIILPLIKKIPHKIEQSHWLQELSRRLRVQEKDLVDEMERTEIPMTEENIPQIGKEFDSVELARPTDNKIDLEEYLLGLLLVNLKKFKRFKRQPAYLFSNSDLAEIFKNLKKCSKKRIKLTGFRENLSNDLANQLDELIFKAEARSSLLDKSADDFKPTKEIRFCFSQLRDRYWRQKLNQINLSIREAEEKKDKDLCKKLTEEANKLTKQVILSKS